MTEIEQQITITNEIVCDSSQNVIDFDRAQIDTLLARLAEEPKRLIVIAGPRQTGKTTLVRAALDRVGRPCRYVALDEPPEERLPRPPTLAEHRDARTLPGLEDGAGRIQMAWREAREDARLSGRGAVVAFDEIQKVSNWQETVKGLWDADRHEDVRLHVVLLGSAPLLVHRGLTESLAGRFETIRLTHWSYGEMEEAFSFDLPAYMYFGGYPGTAELVGAEARWRDYVRTALIEPNIERDILALERVDKPALLKRLFELCCEFSGQILSYGKMVGQLDDAGNATTLARYLDLLGTAGLVAGLQRYEGGVRRRRQSSPKLIVLNTALMAVHAGYTFDEARADRTFWGRVVESAVGAHLINTGSPEIRVYYWRDRGGVEVDFVLERGRRLVLVEVKSNGRGDGRRGREGFMARYKVERSLLVGGEGIPLEEFLSVPAGHWFEAGRER